ncbi:acetyl-CoA carboxylase biotin carboxylase subunit [Spiribacter halobius]|uniref:Biotin carboxylase n=1 Tax=Sediminicurvatus halobius TaxID=2182432 RepID=A0A2U2N9G1_9GAMM|nr:biotin carboxylase N-terminal domain-containing protein [Spiribacter halobius]PWG65821.1 acetyl-CoA carboxylase biotin carboxylase subunit [Spiribacter halobius]UEX77864.1 acetyl-CoA carboxylase biotin carboxylase subunit [Spiribacter halobius]
MQKVLIANRGEIACRIIRSCHRLGLATVAVFSEADADALHVALADEAIPIGPAQARESYLDTRRVLEAATSSAADAVHPGYGFLAENTAFARAVMDAGLVWIGPHPDSIDAMGDKDRARTLATAAGVPVLPGSARFAPDAADADIARAAEAVGYPLLVKASAGGGGIGMKRVDDPAQLVPIARATQSMAEKAFGDGAVFLERYVANARHVEVQVFGFGDGHAVHLGERDCSLQRRYQKVVEESPAPGLPPAVRERMCNVAADLCRQQSYVGAGTVEFVVDADSFEFFFLEMNTRIQVEHPVTEMCTGTDLVAMQIDLARRRLEPLPQDAVRHAGHAIECRLYAENPDKRFMPSPGRLERFVMPTESDGVRVDCGVREGDEITFYYDPMIAKLICHADSREAAVERMLEALGEVTIQGVRSNVEFLMKSLGHPDFRAGRVSTGFVETHLAELTNA